ncbi:MAG: hypothetical protein MSH60_04300 [Ruminococcus sp.]|nr:hypothetical protein [Ruminococcus sp.]
MKSSLHKIQCFFLLLLMIPLLMLTAWAEDPGAKLNSLHFDIALQVLKICDKLIIFLCSPLSPSSETALFHLSLQNTL